MVFDKLLFWILLLNLSQEKLNTFTTGRKGASNPSLGILIHSYKSGVHSPLIWP